MNAPYQPRKHTYNCVIYGRNGTDACRCPEPSRERPAQDPPATPGNAEVPGA